MLRELGSSTHPAGRGYGTYQGVLHSTTINGSIKIARHAFFDGAQRNSTEVAKPLLSEVRTSHDLKPTVEV